MRMQSILCLTLVILHITMTSPNVTTATVSHESEVTMETMQTEMTVPSQNSTIQEERAFNWSWYYFMYFRFRYNFFLAVFGIIGNSLSILILRKPEIKSMPTKIYLISLAVVDLLLGVFLSEWFVYWYGIDLYVDVNDGVCKVLTAFPRILMGTSYWIQVAISIDRFVGITFPFKYRDILFKHRVAVIVGVFLANTLPRSAEFYYLHIHMRPEGYLQCGVEDGSNYGKYVQFYLPWVNLVHDFILPFLIMLVCSVVMVRYLSASQRAVGSSVNQEAQDIARKTTKLFIALNLVFLLTTAPKRLAMIYFYAGDNMFDPNFKYVWGTMWMIMNSNHALNFIVYILHVPKFRGVLKNMLMCRSSESRKNCA